MLPVFTKKQITYIVIGMAIGGFLQLICLQYLKRHPELLDKSNDHTTNATNKLNYHPKNGKPNIRKINVRDGEFISFTAISMKVVITLANHGAWIRLVTSGFAFFKSLPKNQLVSYIYTASPQNLKVKTLTLPENPIVTGREVKWICSENLQYLFILLSADSVPFDLKSEET